MRISGAYGTHLGPLIAVMDRLTAVSILDQFSFRNPTKGEVLELGMGVFSTPYLHYKCLLEKVKLTSIDNDKGWVRKFTGNFGGFKYEGPYHKLIYVEDWKNADIDKPWDLVLVDHSPDFRRIEEVKRLANLAQYIIIHDSNERHEDKYHYSSIYPLFKYKKVWNNDDRHATVLSNFNKLEDLW